MGIFKWLFGPSRYEIAMEKYTARLRYLYLQAGMDDKTPEWILCEVNKAMFEFLTQGR